MKYLRWLLFPFSLLYGLVVIFRNWCYDAGVFKSYKFTKPVISVGNLDVGGAGKSPMVEYLIRLFKDNPDNYQGKLATLSRGYGRKTKGYLVAEGVAGCCTVLQGVAGVAPTADATPAGNSYLPLTLASIVGDEPAQFKHKFPDITVAVCEDRVEGLKQLLPDHDLILLDDAYQHRAVEPGLSILLFDYNRVSEPHLLLPAGNMREPFSGRWRAQVLVVTKCPQQLSREKQEVLAAKVEPLPYQALFFTSIAYQPLQDLAGKPAGVVVDKDTTVFLLTGIANPQPLARHLNSLTPHIIHHDYPDHHPFTIKNITKLAGEFGACASQKKIIITTEKDAQRLEESWFNTGLPNTEKLPVFVLPIRVEFLNNTGQQFDKIVIDYVREHTAHNSLH